MKKYFALILSVLTVLTCLTACKAKVKEGLVLEGQKHVLATNDNGGIIRDENHNVIMMVTDEDGKNVKDENGEYKTNPVKIEQAIVLSDRIEDTHFAIKIPNGWEDSQSGSDVHLHKKGTEHKLHIIVNETTTFNKALENAQTLIGLAKQNNPSAVTDSKEVKITDEITAQFKSVYVEDTGIRYEGEDTIVGMYAGFFIFEHNGLVYNCRMDSIHDMSEVYDEVIAILGSIEFVG